MMENFLFIITIIGIFGARFRDVEQIISSLMSIVFF